MFKPRLVVTNRHLPAVEERLKREFDVRRPSSTGPISPMELLALADGADAMFITPMDRLDATFVERVSKSVKVISTY